MQEFSAPDWYTPAICGCAFSFLPLSTTKITTTTAMAARIT